MASGHEKLVFIIDDSLPFLLSNCEQDVASLQFKFAVGYNEGSAESLLYAEAQPVLAV